MLRANGTMQENGHSQTSEQNKKRRQPQFSLASGDRPLDGYTIKRGVGRGGFGEVYYAVSDAGKEVALKCVQRNLAIELRGVRHCLNLKHVNLVSLFDIKYDANEQAWVVMEYVSGESLQDVIERNPNGMPREELIKWFGGIAAGVAYLHDCGIVHRDLKPANIFIDGDVVKIGDYGLSKYISCSRRSGQTQSVGTFHYMAPEIGQGRYGKEIDLYALGVMLYEMLTGRVPFDGESSQEIIMKHLTSIPDMQGIADPYRSVIVTALEKEPALRRQTAGEMRDVVLGHKPLTAADIPISTSSVPMAEAIGAAAGRAAAAAKESIPKAIGVAVQSGAAAQAAYANASKKTPRQNPLPPEPIARLVRNKFHDVVTWFEKMSPVRRIVLLIVFAFLAIVTSRVWAGFAVAAVAVYCVYYLGRSALMAPPMISQYCADLVAHQAAPPDQAQAVVRAEPIDGMPPLPRPSAKSMRRNKLKKAQSRIRKRHQMLLSSLRAKPLATQLTELSGSFLLAAMVCGLVGGIGFVVSTSGSGQMVHSAPNFVWITLISTVATWGLLFLSKCWETSTSEPIMRRVFLLITGVTVGVVAWALASVGLNLKSTVAPLFGVPSVSGFNPFVTVAGQPLMLEYVAYFAVFFALIRWWRIASPLRPVRLSIWRSLMCMLGAVLVQVVFPLPGGWLIPLITVIAVQIAAPFLSEEERNRVCLDFAGTEGGLH